MVFRWAEWSPYNSGAQTDFPEYYQAVSSEDLCHLGFGCDSNLEVN